MQSTAKSPSEYIENLPEDRKEPIQKIRAVILQNLPNGFEEQMIYGMLGYVVPHRIFPAGYHCDPQLPLGFMSLASQKHFIALYHMGIYTDPKLFNWFVSQFPKHCKYKLDMGKSCIRFKKMDDIPYDLIGELATKMTVQDWISCYQSELQKNQNR